VDGNSEVSVAADAAAPPAEEPPPRSETEIIIVTGVSGGGRSTVARALENVGYYVVDNLPQALMLQMAELAYEAGGTTKHRDGARCPKPRLLHRSVRSRTGAEGQRVFAAGAVRGRRR
jgi:predicted ATPase